MAENRVNMRPIFAIVRHNTTIFRRNGPTSNAVQPNSSRKAIEIGPNQSKSGRKQSKSGRNKQFQIKKQRRDGKRVPWGVLSVPTTLSVKHTQLTEFTQVYTVTQMAQIVTNL